MKSLADEDDDTAIQSVDYLIPKIHSATTHKDGIQSSSDYRSEDEFIIPRDYQGQAIGLYGLDKIIECIQLFLVGCVEFDPSHFLVLHK